MKNNKKILKINVRTWGQTLFKNGFTLIELLAVLVILAIIALIAIPQILSLIDNAKEKSTKVSAKNYLRAVEVAIMNKDTDIEAKNLNGTYEIKDNGKKIVSENNTIDIEFDGQGLKEGYLTITNYKVSALDTKIDKYSIRLIEGEIFLFEEKEIEKSILVTGQKFNSIIKSLVNGSNASYSFVDEKVTSIDFYSNGLLPSGHTKETLDLLPNENVSINNDATAYNDNGKIYILSDKLISFNEDSSCMFYNLTLVNNIIFRNVNTIEVQSINWMFRECDSLTELDLNKFNTSNVTNMSYMFYGCNNLTSIDLKHFDTSNVKDMRSMFSNCSKITKLDVSNFNTSNVIYMNGMFDSCTGLTTLDLSNFDTSSVINMNSMFRTCRNLTNLQISSFNTSNVTDMSQMFNSCAKLTILDVSHFDTSNVTNMSYMFYYCSGLTSLNVNNFNTSNVTNMYMMFSCCLGLTSLNISNFNTSNVQNMGSMFLDSQNLEILNIRNFSVNENTNIAKIFVNTKKINQITIGCGWKLEIDLENIVGSNYTQEQFNALIEQTQANCSAS